VTTQLQLINIVIIIIIIIIIINVHESLIYKAHNVASNANGRYDSISMYRSCSLVVWWAADLPTL